jgi:hypothetical protein
MPKKRPYNPVSDEIQHLLSDRYLFVQAYKDGIRYTFRIEKHMRVDDYDDIIEYYTVHMTSRELPVAYVHTFDTWDKTYALLHRFKNKEIIANESKKGLPELLKSMV